MIRNMDQESLFGRMAIITKESIETICVMVREGWCGVMDHITLETGNRERCMVKE
jgi:hypothetical protein